MEGVLAVMVMVRGQRMLPLRSFVAFKIGLSVWYAVPANIATFRSIYCIFGSRSNGIIQVCVFTWHM